MREGLTVSLVSLLVNLLILPVQPAVIGFGTLVVLGGWLHPLLGQLLGWLAWLPLTWTVAIVEWWGRLPFASFDVGRVPGNGAMLATAGNLVFHGDMNRRFRAFDAETGKKLWEAILGGNVMKLLRIIG